MKFFKTYTAETDSKFIGLSYKAAKKEAIEYTRKTGKITSYGKSRFNLGRFLLFWIIVFTFCFALFQIFFYGSHN